MKINLFEVFGAVSTIGIQVGMKVVKALEDNVLYGPELAEIFKTSLQALRMAGVSNEDIDKVRVITTRAEFDQLDFKDGDVLVYGPEELTKKLRIEV